MAFTNDAGSKDDFRKVGDDAIAGFEPANSPSNPTEHASSENVELAGEADDLEDDETVAPDDLVDDEDEDDDLEDDEDEDDEDEDDLDDDDLEDDDAEEIADADEDDLEDDDEDEDDLDDELEDDGDTVKARNTATAAAARNK